MMPKSNFPIDASVIIVNYKTSGLIVDCIHSIMKHTEGIIYEVIIVDNNSEPEFESIIRSGASIQNDKNFKFIGLPENIGFGRANNEGIKIASGRNIFFLNPDTLLANNAINILSNFLDNNPKAGACGGNLINKEGKPIHSFRNIFPGVFWEFNELLNNIPQNIIYGKISKFYNQTENPIKVSFITGADLMVKREVLDKTGPFCDKFFMYFEETDLCHRIKNAGYNIYNVPKAMIYHLESKSFEADGAWQSELKTRIFEESRDIYYRRNTNRLQRNLSNLLYILNLESRIIFLRNPGKKGYYKLRKQYFYSDKGD